MAALNFTPISLYYSTTAAAVPSAGNLVSGELAINITDEKLYFKNAAGTVKLLASNATSAPVTSFQTSLSGLTPSTSTTGAVTLAGTLGTSSGGTNLTSFTSGGVVYASSTSALTTGSTLYFNGAGLAIGTTTVDERLRINGSSDATSRVRLFNQGTELGAVGSQLGYTGSGGANTLLVIGSTDLVLGSGGTISLTSGGNTQRFAIGSAGQFGIGGTPDYGSSGQVLTSGGASAAPTWATPASGVSLSANNTWTGTQSFIGTASAVATVLQDVAETATVSATAATGTITYFPSTQSVLYYTSNASGNWVLNITFGALTTMNTALSTGQSMTIAFLVTNGGTAYYNTSVTVDGAATTVRWQGGTTPSSGNANSIDVYTYTVIKTGSAAFLVLASQTKFA